MTRIDHALVTIPFETRQIESLKAALAPARVTVVTDGQRGRISQALETADVAFIKGTVDSSLLNAPRIRWIHSDHSGLEKSATPALFERRIILTGSAGRSAPALAEHALMFMSALNFGYPRLYQAQRAGDWAAARKIVLGGRPLCERTLGIVGTGHTGRALAARAAFLGMRVEGYRRQDAGPLDDFDCVYSRDAGDSLEPLLRAADFLVLCAPLSDETAGLIGRAELAMMKSGACIINIARGPLIDDVALVDALDRGQIAGAALDTFTAEPLPASSPLWRHPRILITPHARPGLSDRSDRVLKQLLDNIALYRSDSGLNNRLTEEGIYTRRRAPGSDNGRRRILARLASPAVRALRPRQILKRGLNWSVRRLGLKKQRKYPLRPDPRARCDIRRYSVNDIASVEVFWKKINQSVVPSISLFVHGYEVLRFDCAGPRFGHYHVADNSGFYRILMFEQDKLEQIERGLFEIRNNHQYYFRQNPVAAVREAQLDPDGLVRACGKARETLQAYATASNPADSEDIASVTPNRTISL